MKHLILLWLTAVIVTLSGCGAGSETGEGIAVQEMPAPMSAELPPEMPNEAPRVSERQTDSPGKPQSPIGIRYEIMGRPQVGQALEISLTVQAATPVSGLRVQLESGPGLFVPPEDASFGAALLGAGEPVVRAISVTPVAEGALELHVLAQGEINGRVQANNVTVPIQVGTVEVGTRPAVTTTTDDSGVAIISLPAGRK